MSLLRGALTRLVEDGLGHTLMYATGRFDSFRRVAHFAHSFTRKRSSFDLRQSLFPQLDVEEALLNVDRKALHLDDVNLSPGYVTDILDYAQNTQCFVYLTGTSRKRYFHHLDHEKVEADIGRSVLLGRYDDPAAGCPAIARIQNDPKLLEISSRYLNGDPRITAMLWWSFPKQASVEERLNAKQTVLFHFDLQAYQYIYFNFYLTEVDVTTGPHVVVLGSHRRKKFSHLLGSANQSDENIIRYYGQENIVTIYGEAGYGFIEDSFCYHKAVAPTQKSRLLLQIRMY